MKISSGLTCLLVAFSALGFAVPAGAAPAPAASEWVETEQTRLRLVSAVNANAGEPLQLGLQFELQPGWKVYWRSPGDAGFPPTIDWQGSSNLQSARIDWPVPERFSVLGLETLGYKKQVVFPITVEPASPAEPLNLRAAVNYLTCDDICIPYDAELALSLPAGPAAPSPHAHLINRYATTVPDDGRKHGLEIAALDTWAQGEDGRRAMIRITARARTGFENPDAFIEGPPGLAYGKPVVRLSDSGKGAQLDVPVDGLDLLDDDKGKTLAGRRITVTLVDGNRAAERALDALGVVAPTGPPILSAPVTAPGTAAPPAAPSFRLMILFALLGGLILNLMPCVLPVLSLKMLSVVKHGGGAPRDVRLGFLASAAGIVATFLVLAATLAALRAGGMAIGWGIQFQQPWFLTLMIMLVTVFACNLWGFFEVRLPAFVSDLGPHTGQARGLGGHFLQGSFATLLATPCTAPFLGTAVGFALAGPVPEMFMLFAVLGLGLALPYLAVAAVPRLATWLPRPGPWMVKMKAVLGLLLAATGVWLLYVLAGVAGFDGSLVVAGIAVATATVLLGAHRTGGLGLKLSAPGLTVLAAVALSVPLWTSAGARTGGGTGESDALKAIWQPFAPDAIPALVADGKTVFVDITADWCITCQVNKAVAMERGDVLERLGAETVVAMQADWTRPDDEISTYLASFGRFGIPFNAVYGPKAPQGIVLPELLTPGIVLGALDSAADGPALAGRP